MALACANVERNQAEFALSCIIYNKPVDFSEYCRETACQGVPCYVGIHGKTVFL
jgi:hypothetical protein